MFAEVRKGRLSAARGKHIISAAKSLKATQLADQNIAAYLDAISIAGRTGLFASALRHVGKISLERRCSLFMRGSPGANCGRHCFQYSWRNRPRNPRNPCATIGIHLCYG